MDTNKIVMKIHYIVSNPLTGENVECETLDDALQTRKKIVRAFWKVYEEGFCIIKCIKNADGSQTWENDPNIPKWYDLS